MFNLLTEPWLPLNGVDGGIANASIGEALLDPQRWAGIASVNPVECISIHRLLLAICHRAIGPGDLNQRSALLDAWPHQKIQSYLSQWADRFDLFHPTHPFLQTPGLKGAGANLRPWTTLAPDRATGKSRLLWDHSLDNNVTPITSAEAARALIAHQQFVLGGTVRFLQHSGNQGPLVNWVVVIPTGDTLQQTIVDNLICQTAAEHQQDLPPWEMEPPALDDLRDPVTPIIPAGPAQRYSWLSRAVEMQPLEDGSVAHLFYGGGQRMAPTPTPDPMTPMVQGNQGLIPLRLQEDKTFWRDFHSLAGGEGSTAPAVAVHAATLQQLRCNYNPLELIAGGFCSGAQIGKPGIWRLEFRRLSPELLQPGPVNSIAQSAVNLANSVSNDLNKALKALFCNWVSSNNRGKVPSPTDIKKLQDSTQAMAHYWAALEPEFWGLVDQLSSGITLENATTRWANTLKRIIQQTWEHAIGQLGRDARALAAAAGAEGALARVFSLASWPANGRKQQSTCNGFSP